MRIRTDSGRIFGFLSTPRTIRRFSRNEGGTTAVEFAILAFPFFLLLFAIVESSLMFFAGQMLESSVDEVGRKIRTGQLDNTMTEQEFKDEICAATSLLFTCADIDVDLSVAATFDALGDPPLPVDGEVDHSSYSFESPCPEQIAMITVSYEWPTFTNYVEAHLADLNNGNALLNAIAVFRTEPYPAQAGGCS